MRKVAIYGAGGFGRELATWIETSRDFGHGQFVGFLDDDPSKITVRNGEKIDDVVISVASPSFRAQMFRKLESENYPFRPLIHSDVSIHSSNKIGKGAVICSGVKITSNVQLDDFVIINLNVVIGHDVRICSFASIMPSANVLGGAFVGAGAFIGAGATILQNIVIGEGAIVGAGAVVTHDVEPGSKVMGVPARPFE